MAALTRLFQSGTPGRAYDTFSDATPAGNYSAGFVAASSQYYTGTTIAFGTSDFAFACFVYLNDITGVKTIVSLGTVADGTQHLWLAVSGASLFLSLNDSVQGTRLTHSFGAGFVAGWNHIIVNFDRSANATCYINGGNPTAQTKDISAHSAAMNPTTFYVGRKVAGSDYMDGRIDKLLYTNALLDAGEIAELSGGANLGNLSSALAAKAVYGWEMDAADGGTQTSAFTSNDLVATNTPTQEPGWTLTSNGMLFNGMMLLGVS